MLRRIRHATSSCFRVFAQMVEYQYLVDAAATNLEPPDPASPQVPFGTRNVGLECEAYVSGRYHELVRGRVRRPAWVDLNAVAHGERRDLERLAGGSTAADRQSAALSYLAYEVLCTCDQQRVPLHIVQRELLVPLEAELLDIDPRFADPSLVINVVRDRLARRLTKISPHPGGSQG